LTTFSSAIIPPIVIPEFKEQLTKDNIKEHWVLVALLVGIWFFFVLLSLYGLYHDRKMDQRGLNQTFALLEAEELRMKQLKLSKKCVCLRA
jgi:hypothetical protein